jgi:RecB family exonuclease
MVHYDGEHDWRQRHRDLTLEFNNLLFEEREEYGDLPAECARLMKNYLAHYKDEDAHWRTLDTELDETVDLPNGDQFNFIIDKVTEEDDGGIWLVDYKSVTNLMSDNFMLLDSQLAKYVWAAAQIGYKKIRGVMFDEICTATPTLPKVLQSGSLEQRKDIRCDVHTYYREIRRHDLNPRDYGVMIRHLNQQTERWFRRTRMPRDKPTVQQTMREMMMTSQEIKDATERNYFPRTVDKKCEWDCEYVHPCIVEMQGGKVDEITRLQFTTVSREKDLEDTHMQILTGGK